jgi:hypothetical protein
MQFWLAGCVSVRQYGSGCEWLTLEQQGAFGSLDTEHNEWNTDAIPTVNMLERFR